MNSEPAGESVSLPTASLLRAIVDQQLRVRPDHARFLCKRFATVEPEEAAFLERLARCILEIAGDQLESFCHDYDWLVSTVLEEELHFRRQGRYRLDTLEQAIQQVYSRPDIMTRYMNGLLMTQLWWSNHTHAMMSYERDFLASASGRCIEIGPGHGLLMHLAAESGFSSVEALDISTTSIEMTRTNLRRVGGDVDQHVFHLGDLFDTAAMARFANSFGGIVFSEVLEHLDRPDDAMRMLFAITKPGGRVFIHVPVNSPAPDHLFLLRSPDEAKRFVGRFGFDVLVARSFPATNMTLDQAIRLEATVSCVFVLKKPPAASVAQVR